MIKRNTIEPKSPQEMNIEAQIAAGNEWYESKEGKKQSTPIRSRWTDTITPRGKNRNTSFKEIKTT